MSMSFISRATTADTWSFEKSRTFPKGFWTGIAMALTIWAALVCGTTLSVSTSSAEQPAELVTTHS